MLRVSVSLLLSEGHRNAEFYPIAKIWYEAEIVKERVNARISTEVVSLHAAMVAVASPKGKGVAHLEKLLKDLRDG